MLAVLGFTAASTFIRNVPGATDMNGIASGMSRLVAAASDSCFCAVLATLTVRGQGTSSQVGDGDNSLLLNSVAVIIGSMLLVPLTKPMLRAGLALVQGNAR